MVNLTHFQLGINPSALNLAVLASCRFTSFLCIFSGILPHIRCDDTPNDKAVASRERSAAKVSFQRLQESFPPTQNDNSAASAEFPASHFGG